MRKLSDVQVTHVSFVDKGANNKTFFLTKSAEELEKVVQKTIAPITKEDDAQKIVYGVVYEPDIEDSHGDFMTSEDIEKSAHGFLAEHRKIDKQHNFSEGYGDVVESYIAPTDMTIGDQGIVKGSWILAVKASDEIWDDIQKGEITGFSLAGTAVVEEINKSVKEGFEANAKRRNIWALMDALQEEIMNAMDEGYPSINFDKVVAGAREFIDIVEQIMGSTDATDVFKADKAGFDTEKEIWIVEELTKSIEAIVTKKEETPNGTD